MTTTARDLMTTQVTTVEPSLPLTDLEITLIAAKVGGAPVVSEGQLLGVVTRSDVFRALAEEHRRAEAVVDYFHEEPLSLPSMESVGRESQAMVERLAKLRVEDVMSRTLITVEPDQSVEDVAHRMLANRIHRILVVDGDRLLGIISSLDLVRLLTASP